MNRLDAEIARQEETLRENWADMTDAAQDAGRARLHHLRQARNELGARIISPEGEITRVLVMPTDEEQVLACGAAHVLQENGGNSA